MSKNERNDELLCAAQAAEAIKLQTGLLLRELEERAVATVEGTQRAIVRVRNVRHDPLVLLGGAATVLAACLGVLVYLRRSLR